MTDFTCGLGRFIKSSSSTARKSRPKASGYSKLEPSEDSFSSKSSRGTSKKSSPKNRWFSTDPLSRFRTSKSKSSLGKTSSEFSVDTGLKSEKSPVKALSFKDRGSIGSSTLVEKPSGWVEIFRKPKSSKGKTSHQASVDSTLSTTPSRKTHAPVQVSSSYRGESAKRTSKLIYENPGIKLTPATSADRKSMPNLKNVVHHDEFFKKYPHGTYVAHEDGNVYWWKDEKEFAKGESAKRTSKPIYQ
jgi:hypothetical protein